MLYITMQMQNAAKYMQQSAQEAAWRSKGLDQKEPNWIPWEKVVVEVPQVDPAEKAHEPNTTYLKVIPLDLEHGKLEVTSPVSSVDPPSARTGFCRGEWSK